MNTHWDYINNHIASKLICVLELRKPSAYSAGDLGSIPGQEDPPGEGNGNPLQYSCLENPRLTQEPGGL